MLAEPVGTITSVVIVGTPPHQLAAAFQFELAPSHIPFGFTVNVRLTGAVGPPHPKAETEIVAVPEKAGSNTALTEVPLPLMLFPVPVTDQEYPVALLAEVVNPMVDPWQNVLVPDGVVGEVTSGLRVIDVLVLTRGHPPAAAIV